MIDKNKIKEAKIKEPVKNEFYELLKSKFPQTINSDGAVNFDTIKMLLDIKVKENIKGYELNWIGKGLANALYNTPCDKELKFNETKSKNTDTTQNIIIKGDNLDALKILKSAYYEKIKMIYIDPPYNTKNDDFIYPDDFRKDYKQICIETGLIKIETDEFGNKTEVPSEAMNFFTSVTSTKSHSGWLSFMLPRLKLARDLLKDDGVIFISIDDNEQANLKLLCDEIFGEENFVADFIWWNKYTTANDTDISNQHEYVLCFAKNRAVFNANLLPRTEKQNISYKNKDNDPKGAWKPTPLHARSGNDSNIYTIEFPNGISWTAPKGRYPRYSKEKLLKLYSNGELYFNANGGVDKKTYLSEVRDGVSCGTLWHYNNFGHTHSNNEELAALLGKGIFNDPKGTKLLNNIIQLATNPTENDIILDFFAGSGTTAHAVMAQNAQDNGNRKFILVQLDEKIDEKKSKTAFDFCKNELGSKEPVISDITIERVKRAGNKLEKSNLDTGFCVYDLTDKDTLIQKSDGTLDLYLNRDLTPLDKALNLALQSGKMVDIKSEEICKDKLYKFDDSYYIVSYDKNVLESLEATIDKPVYISGYSDIKLDDFLNLQSVLKDRLNVVY